MAAKLYSDIFVLLSNFKRSADRSWLENPPQAVYARPLPTMES